MEGTLKGLGDESSSSISAGEGRIIIDQEGVRVEEFNVLTDDQDSSTLSDLLEDDIIVTGRMGPAYIKFNVDEFVNEVHDGFLFMKHFLTDLADQYFGGENQKPITIKF